MPRKPTPPERKDVNYSVAMPLEMASYLSEVAPVEFRVKSGADVVRLLVSSVRTMWSLPPFMADRLTQDMRERNVTFAELMQDLAARHYEKLKEHDAGKKR